VSALDEILELEAESIRLSNILEEIDKRIRAYQDAIEPSRVEIRRQQRRLDELRENEKGLRDAPIILLKEYASLLRDLSRAREDLAKAAKYSADVERGLKVQRIDHVRHQELLDNVVATKARYGRVYFFPKHVRGGNADQG
jgi:hypothetical protein